MTATNDAYNITELKAKVGSAAISAALIGAVLKDGSTVLGSRSFDTATNTTAYFTGLNIAVPANTTKTLTVDLILSQPSATASTSAVDAKVTLDLVKAYNSKGVEYTGTNVTGDRAANTLYVFQSIPTFSEVNLTNTTALSNGSNSKIYSFKVAADSKGSVILKQLKFTLGWNDSAGTSTLTLNNFKFYRGSTNLTSTSVTIQNASGASVEGSASVVEADTTAGLILTFDDGYEETIPAGSEYTYSLYATPNGFTYSTSKQDSFTINLPAESATHTTNNYVEITSGIVALVDSADANDVARNVIWSDNSAVSHSDTSASSSNDWTDGNLVLNLPLDTETWPVQ